MGRGAEKNYSSNLLSLQKVLTCDAPALCEGVSLIALVTNTDRDMAADPAGGVNATQTRAGVHTSLVLASKLCWAVIVEYALWMTIWWGTNHSCLTRAVTAVSVSSWGVGIGSTWIGYTWVLLDDRFNG